MCNDLDALRQGWWAITRIQKFTIEGLFHQIQTRLVMCIDIAFVGAHGHAPSFIPLYSLLFP
jgi:hypothetical protein